jgi:hypothetical protein
LVKQTPMKCRFFEKNYTFLLIYPWWFISSFSREQFSLKLALAYLKDLHNVRMLHKLHGGDFSLDLQVLKSTKRKTIKSRSSNNTCNLPELWLYKPPSTKSVQIQAICTMQTEKFATRVVWGQKSSEAFCWIFFFNVRILLWKTCFAAKNWSFMIFKPITR